jgi:flagellar biosynthesis protein FlhG
MREIARRYRQSALSSRPYVITVTSGKGGVGKSTISLNLALKLSDFGKRVLLFDADANLGGIDVMLGVVPRFRLSHVLRGERDIEDVLISPSPGLRLLPGSSGEVDYPLMTGPAQMQLLDDLQLMEEKCDILVIDTGAGLTPEIIGYAERSDETIVVTSTEPTAVMDAYAMINILTAAKRETVISVLVNNARLPRDAEDAAQKLKSAVSHFLKRDINYLGSIPSDGCVPRAISQQQPVVRAFPRTAASLSLQSVAQQLMHVSLQSAMRRVEAQ